MSRAMTGKRAPPRWPFSERVTRERVKTETVYSRETERSRALAWRLQFVIASLTIIVYVAPAMADNGIGMCYS